MAPSFHQRLNALMSLTDTTNTQLARELSFDASYISRIRSGKRGVPRHQPFVDPAARFLARRITEPHQQLAAAQMLALPGMWPQDQETAIKYVALWLTEGMRSDDIAPHFDRIIKGLALGLPSSTPTPASAGHANPADSRPTNCLTFGNEGRRAAAESLLAGIVTGQAPQRLLAYSDEDLSWLTEDPAFLQRWSSLLTSFIAGGGSVHIIHTITRSTNQMLDAIQSWLPLYLTGGVRSWHCPRIHNVVNHRSLFVVPGLMCVRASSVGEIIDDSPVLTSSDQQLIAASQREFESLVGLCSPLVHVSNLADNQQVSALLDTLGTMGQGHGLGLFRGSETQGSEPMPHAPIRLQEVLGSLANGTGWRQTKLLPPHVIAIVNASHSFTLVNLQDPQLAMQVSEPLLAEAFAEYLGGTA